MSKLKVFEYRNCGTCKNALKFLDRNKIGYERIPIVSCPPTAAELETMLGHFKGDFRKLFNTSGQVYRDLGLSGKIQGMSETEALRLLAGNGKLIKRPFVLAKRGGLIGFKELEWKKFFANGGVS